MESLTTAYLNANIQSALNFQREKNKVHPTMKPVEMIENQIK